MVGSACFPGFRLNPHEPQASGWLLAAAHALYQLKRYEEAVRYCSESIRQDPDPGPSQYSLLAASYGQLGRFAEARGALSNLRSLGPESRSTWPSTLPQSEFCFRFVDYTYLEHFLDGIRKASLE